MESRVACGADDRFAHSTAARQAQNGVAGKDLLHTLLLLLFLNTELFKRQTEPVSAHKKPINWNSSIAANEGVLRIYQSVARDT